MLPLFNPSTFLGVVPICRCPPAVGEWEVQQSVEVNHQKGIRWIAIVSLRAVHQASSMEWSRSVHTSAQKYCWKITFYVRQHPPYLDRFLDSFSPDPSKFPKFEVLNTRTNTTS